MAVIAALLATSASAMEFQTLGYKAVSMGGAGVASSSASLATYNNPALLANPKSKDSGEVSLGVGVGVHDHGVGDSFKKLDDSNFLNTLDRVASLSSVSDLSTVSTADLQTLIAGKDIILQMDGNALEASPQAEVATKIDNFGFGVFVSSDIVATAHIDQQYDQLIFQYGSDYAKINDNGTVSYTGITASDYTSSSIEYGINNMDSAYVELKGVAIAEVPVAYGENFHFNCGDLMVGGALKYMSGYAYTQTYKIDNSGATSGATKNDKTTTAAGVDLGLAYQPSDVQGLTLGLVGKDLNTPEFKFVDGSKLKVKPMVRAGVAYDILDSLEFAVDVDLTKNETLVTGVDSQMVGGGLNLHTDTWFSARVGAMQNLDSADNVGTIYTAGLGLGPLDVSGQMTTKKSAVNGINVPAYAKVNIALVIRW